jgi:2-polyprenyl-3-methyl-5-hydroxy-6-metoxy-1,4-benzoquinol methylase
MPDPSNGYDEHAEAFSARRHSRIGGPEIRAWADSLPPSARVLDVACGVGAPITEALVDAGCRVCAIDASPRMVAAFSERFSDVPVKCEAVEDSSFFDVQFDGIVAWGLMFLLPEATQLAVFPRLASALNPGGSLVFTAPTQIASWPDNLTQRASISLGRDRYVRALTDAGLTLVRELEDEGQNHYYVSVKR